MVGKRYLIIVLGGLLIMFFFMIILLNNQINDGTGEGDIGDSQTITGQVIAESFYNNDLKWEHMPITYHYNMLFLMLAKIVF